ncbi:restriction endonuclease subunit S [Tenacibaculum sp. IMCC1]
MIKYQQYMASDVTWLNSIPSHWSINQIKRNLKLLTDYDANGSFSNIAKNVNRVEDSKLKYAWFVRTTDLEKHTDQTDILKEFIWIDKSTYNYLGKTKLFGGELLLAKRGDIGRIYIMPKTEYPASLAPNLYLARLNENIITSKFAYYFLISSYGLYQLNLRNKSTTIGALYKDDFKSIEFVIPPLKEQTQIANYLDDKTTLIDKKIKLLKQKIKHYKAYRKTLINETVTKGLDKTVKLKDSGVNWIGEIPEHWEVKRLKDLSNFINGFAFNSKEYIDSGIPIIRISNISNDINFEECKYVDSSYLKLAKDSLIKVNDILVAMTGATIGKNAIYREEKKALLNQRVGIIRAKKLINNLFLFQLIKSQIFKDYIDLLCGGSAQENISKTQIENFYIQLPPLKEQQQIADYLDSKTTIIDKIVTNIETQITTLKELRKTVINEVVTGKVKVTA